MWLQKNYVDVHLQFISIQYADKLGNLNLLQVFIYETMSETYMHLNLLTMFLVF